jgi:hypothetical protein
MLLYAGLIGEHDVGWGALGEGHTLQAINQEEQLGSTRNMDVRVAQIDGASANVTDCHPEVSLVTIAATPDHLHVPLKADRYDWTISEIVEQRDKKTCRPGWSRRLRRQHHLCSCATPV